MKNLTTEELQSIFGPNLLELTWRPGHICSRPCLIFKKGTSPEEKLRIHNLFMEWTHKEFLKTLGFKNDEERCDFVMKRGKFKVPWWKKLPMIIKDL